MELQKAQAIRAIYGNLQHFMKALDIIDHASRTDVQLVFRSPGYGTDFAVPTELVPELRRHYEKAVQAAKHQIEDFD